VDYSSLSNFFAPETTSNGRFDLPEHQRIDLIAASEAFVAI
jgi:hypothetical protein